MGSNNGKDNEDSKRNTATKHHHAEQPHIVIQNASGSKRRNNSIHIDGETLNGLKAVTKPVQANLKRKGEPDPEFVVFSFITGGDKNWESIKAIQSVENSTVYEVTKENWRKTLEDHVKKYGTAKEIILAGHGGSEQISSDEGKELLNSKDFLSTIYHIGQRTGIKACNRIVFSGCRTFSELTTSDIKFYREFSKEYNAEIVGITSYLLAASAFSGELRYRSARYVQFTPTGEVERDKLDNRYNPLTILGNDTSWTDYFIGHTQEEGEALQNAAELQRKAELKRLQWSIKCSEFGPKY